MTNNENKAYCESIAADLKAIYNGELYKCPECGDTVKEGCTCCETDIPADEWEQVSFLDYFNDALDIAYVVASDRTTLRAVRIMVTCGGPNVYVNTWDKQVELYWWTESAKAWIPSEVCDAINEEFEMLWEC